MIKFGMGRDEYNSFLYFFNGSIANDSKFDGPWNIKISKIFKEIEIRKITGFYYNTLANKGFSKIPFERLNGEKRGFYLYSPKYNRYLEVSFNHIQTIQRRPK